MNYKNSYLKHIEEKHLDTLQDYANSNAKVKDYFELMAVYSSCVRAVYRIITEKKNEKKV